MTAGSQLRENRRRRVPVHLLWILLASCVGARPADDAPSALRATDDVPLAILSRGFRPGVGHWASTEALP
jgi:hypothetical protein